MIRETVLASESTQALYQLCREAPPAAKRPNTYRWSLWAHAYDGLSAAYREGLAGQQNGYHATSFCAAAWLAGRDAA